MDLNHSISFKSAAANGHLTDFMQTPTPMLPQIPQPTNEATEEGERQKKLDPLEKHLNLFWQDRNQEVKEMTDGKQHQFPLARIKKVMKSDERVKMISANVPLLFAKACEFLILELTSRSWLETESSHRRTLQRADIANAIRRSPSFDFLRDIVPIQQHDEDQRANRQVLGQQISQLPNEPLSGSNGLIRPNGFNEPSRSNIPNHPNGFHGLNVPRSLIMPSVANAFSVPNGPNVFNVQNGPNCFIGSSGANGDNGPSISNAKTGLNSFHLPSSLIGPSGADAFNGPGSSIIPNGRSFPTMDYNVYQQDHDVPLTNNLVQVPMTPTNQYQMNRNRVDVEGFYGGNMGVVTPNGMFYSPRMSSANQFHQNFYIDNQAGSSSSQMIGCNEAEFQVAPLNEMHFSGIERNGEDIGGGTSNGTQFGMFVPSCEPMFQASTSSVGRRNDTQFHVGPSNFSMYGSNEAQLIHNEPLNFALFAHTEAESQNGPSNFGMPNDQQHQSGKGKQSWLQ